MNKRGLALAPEALEVESELISTKYLILMPFNLSGALAVFDALVRPRLLLPNLTVQGPFLQAGCHCALFISPVLRPR